MFYYARDKTEPKVSALVEIAKATGVSIEWLAVGDGDVLRKTEVHVEEASINDIRRLIWNIAETYWEQTPKRIKPKVFADKFLETFDHLLTRKNIDGNSTSEVIQFSAQQLKRASGSDAQ
nr:helix-turn-helix domain-containing protein [Roseibium litorale]